MSSLKDKIIRPNCWKTEPLNIQTEAVLCEKASPEDLVQQLRFKGLKSTRPLRNRLQKHTSVTVRRNGETLCKFDATQRLCYAYFLCFWNGVTAIFLPFCCVTDVLFVGLLLFCLFNISFGIVTDRSHDHVGSVTDKAPVAVTLCVT